MISSFPKSLRIGLYGAGPHSLAVLLPALAGLDHPLEAVCDPRGDLADDLAERFAFRATFTDLASLVRDTSVQALIISRDSPNVSEITEPLLKSRLPFWIDAAAPGLDELLVRLRRRSGSGSTYMISQPHRFGTAFVLAEELLRLGRLERPVMGSMEISSPKSGPVYGELPIEYLLEGGLDLLIFLLGQASRAYAAWDGGGMLSGLVHFEQTAVSIQIRQGVEPSQAGHCLRLYGQRSEELSVRNLLDLSASQSGAILARSVEPLTSSLDVCRQHGWTGSLSAFLSEAGHIGGNFPDMTGFLQTRKVSEGVIRSASTGREVRLRA